MKKVLLLGGNGYLGQSFRQALIRNGHRVVCVGRSAFDSQDDYHKIDITDKNTTRYLKNLRCDLVIDLVSYIAPNTPTMKLCEIKHALKSYNQLIQEYFKSLPYIFISSGGTVYGQRTSPAKETDDLKPISSYGIQKAIQEETINRSLRNGIILRVTNPYGGGQTVKHGVGFVKYLEDNVKNKADSINLIAPSNTVRDYIKISDVAKIVSILIDEPIDSLSTYNVSTGYGASLKEVVSLVSDSFNVSLRIDEKLENFQSDKHIYYNVLENKKVLERTGVSSVQPIKEVLANSVNWNSF